MPVDVLGGHPRNHGDRGLVARAIPRWRCAAVPARPSPGELVRVGQQQIEDVADRLQTATCPASSRSMMLPAISSAVRPPPPLCGDDRPEELRPVGCRAAPRQCFGCSRSSQSRSSSGFREVSAVIGTMLKKSMNATDHSTNGRGPPGGRRTGRTGRTREAGTHSPAAGVHTPAAERTGPTTRPPPSGSARRGVGPRRGQARLHVAADAGVVRPVLHQHERFEVRRDPPQVRRGPPPGPRRRSPSCGWRY